MATHPTLPLRRRARRIATNVARHGVRAPRWGQRIWVAPDMVQQAPSASFGREDSGRVVGGDWDQDSVDVLTFWKMQAAFRHWRDGVPWEETGVYEQMLEAIRVRGRKVDRCGDLDDIVRRYRKLDALFERIRRDRALATSAQLGLRPARCEVNGIYIHIDRHARPMFAKGGFHRLAIAKILELPVAPAQVGVVHPMALPKWQRFTAAERPAGDRYPGSERAELL